MSVSLVIALILFAVVFYTYFAYPVLMTLAAKLFGRPETIAPVVDEIPDVAVLITMHNGSALIEEKLKTLANVEYAGNLSVNFILDGCTDDTEQVIANQTAEGYIHPVRVWPQPQRNGKEAAIRAAMPNIVEPVVMFTDADAVVATDCIQKLVDKLREPNVGVACGNELHHTRKSLGAGSGQGLFYKYESYVKKQQERVTSLTYVQGGVFAMWKDLYPPTIPPGATQDGVIAFHTVLEGKRVAFVEDAISEEFYDVTTGADYARRFRTISRAFYAICCYWRMFLPHKGGQYGLHVLSSRVLRWLTVPIVLVANSCLVPSLLENHLLAWTIIALELAFLVTAVFGYVMEQRGKRMKLPYFCYYFTYIHVAAAIAVTRAVLGHRVTTWTPTANQTPTTSASSPTEQSLTTG